MIVLAKQVGLSRNINYQWLHRAVELLDEITDEDEYKQALNSYLSFEISSATNLRKTREILMHIWYYNEFENAESIRIEARKLIKRYPDYELCIHWCMLLLAFPVFVDISKNIGRISDYNETISLSLLKEKLFDEWGERATLFHSTDKIISTMKALNVLETEKPGKYTIKKYSVSKPDVANFMLRVAMMIDKGSYYSFGELTDFDILFPFDYNVSKEHILADDHFMATHFAGEMTFSLKE